MDNIPHYIIKAIESKKSLNIKEMIYLTQGTEEFDFDCYQEYYIFKHNFTATKHARLVIVRYTSSRNDDVVTTKISIKNLIKVK